MNKEIFGGIMGTSVSAVGTSMQSNEVLERISLIITIIGALITTFMALINWWKNAKKDGKITKEEIKDGIDIISNGGKTIQDITDKEEVKNDIQGKNGSSQE